MWDEQTHFDFEAAKRLQGQLFPKSRPPVINLDYYGICREARGIGGDYYEFVKLDAWRLFVAVGDVSGKGICAALLMAYLQALVRSCLRFHSASPKDLVSEINAMVSARSGCKYTTLFSASYDSLDRTLTYVNAGHPPPLLIRPGKRPASEPEVLRLQPTGTVVGAFSGADYEQVRQRLCPEDVLLIFTDGVTEAANSGGEEFGERRLMHLATNHLDLRAEELVHLIISELDRFTARPKPQDDQALVVVKVADPNSSRRAAS